MCVRTWLNLYGYRGFFKTPTGIIVEPTSSGPVQRPFHPALDVWGASLRGDLAGTVSWIEGGWYNVRESGGTDSAGREILVPESSLRWILGAERQIATDLTFGLQWYAEAEFQALGVNWPRMNMEPALSKPAPRPGICLMGSLGNDDLITTIACSAGVTVRQHGTEDGC